MNIPCLLAVLLAGALIVDVASAVTLNPYDPVGVFLNRAMWQRAKTRGQNATTPFFASQYQQIFTRANLNAVPTPWFMSNMSRPVAAGGIIYGWSISGVYYSLSNAGNQFNSAADTIQALALAYTFSNNTAYAQKAVSYAMAWAVVHTPVNMYDFNISFAQSTFEDSSNANRTWNFALDDMWSTYGLMCISDAYFLLKSFGYNMSSANDTAFRNWIRKVAAGVNSGFHSWTRWADTHASNPSSGSYIRYRSDNHLSWSQTGLIAAGVALSDWALVNYTVFGGTWTDAHNITYTNPSPLQEMISRAINGSTGEMFEELIGRTPLIGYSFFHIEAQSLIAIIAQIHTGVNMFTYVGRNGSNLKTAYNRYVPYVLGLQNSTDTKESGTNFGAADGWLYEIAYLQWPTLNFSKCIATYSRNNYILQGPGPVALFWGEYPVIVNQTCTVCVYPNRTHI